MSSSQARPKRSGEEAFHAGREAKKPRFDARNPSTLAAVPAAEDDDLDEQDELVLDADVIGRRRARGAGAPTKRNAVNIDGYDSDSENENFDARAAEREKERRREGEGVGVSRDEEDDDMFAEVEEVVQGTADGDEDEDVMGGKRKKKDVRFLDQQEIEGQVMNSTSGGHVSSEILLGGGSHGKRRASAAEEDGDESGSESSDDETRAAPPDPNETPLLDAELAAEIGAGGKKKHAPRLDAFNLRDEEEEGRFDAAGNYVRRAIDPDAANDGWLEGLSRRDMRRAREAAERRAADLRARDAADDALLSADLLSALLARLEPGETPLEALQRLNRARRPAVHASVKKVPKWKTKRRAAKDGEAMEVDGAPDGATDGPETGVDAAETARRQAVEAITGAADALYTREEHDIYDMERERLLRMYRRETGEDWTAPTTGGAAANGDSHRGVGEDASQDVWQYRWQDARDGGGEHGPYDAPTMKAWQEAGYFGQGVEFRRVGDDDWSLVLDIK